ncbi:hypothetical protein ACIQWN_28835 [Streptomyces vinaceus]|uniref:hypothetical protein n=1 Tax=Streptomyces vinaceus TaxID=1960 RepID=UPI0038091053
MTGEPNLRDRAIDAVAQALNAGRYWLPTEGQTAVVDAVLAVALSVVHDELRGQADHHDTCDGLSKYPETAAGHHELAAGFLAAAGHVQTLHRPTT